MIYDLIPCVLCPLCGIKYSSQIICMSRRRNIMIATDKVDYTNRY